VNLNNLVLCAILLPGVANAGNFATCILDKTPGVQNDAAAMATNKVCIDKYPGGFAGVEKGSGRGFLSFDSGAECAAKKAAGTPSLIGGRLIYSACIALYDKPRPQEQFKIGVFDDLVPQNQTPGRNMTAEEFLGKKK
jgi:hypothetical protein